LDAITIEIILSGLIIARLDVVKELWASLLVRVGRELKLLVCILHNVEHALKKLVILSDHLVGIPLLECPCVVHQEYILVFLQLGDAAL
jgi:hypothetical protein